MSQGVVVDSAQARLGLKTGDIPVGVNGIEYDNLHQILTKALMEGGTLEVKRDGKIVKLPITLQDRANMLALQKLISCLQSQSWWIVFWQEAPPLRQVWKKVMC